MTPILQDLIMAYKDFLIKEHPDCVKKYNFIEKNNADGAKFEAVCYWILRSRGLNVEIGDRVTKGGADFECSNTCCRFVVEVTTISTVAMERKTCMKNDQTGVSGGCYGSYPTLYAKLADKIRQVEKYEVPRMVIIGSFHNESLTLFRHVMADEYLAVFFNRDDVGRPQPQEALKGISAFTLMAFSNKGYRAMAFLNPDPSHPFGVQLLPDIRFRRVTNMGLIDGPLLGEWVSLSNSSSHSFDYPFEITMTGQTT